MNIFLVLSFLFFIGSVSGWVMELLFRRFLSSANPEKKWINPGFCTGPYLPIYGYGLCVLYLITMLEGFMPKENVVLDKIILFVFMAFSMTAIEYIAGIISLKCNNVRLWDYSDEWGNIQGIICPKFSLIWAVLGAIYYFLIHPHILVALHWLSMNKTFSFVIGFFFGIFIVDAVHSTHLLVKLKKFAEENDVVLKYEALNSNIRSYHEKTKEKYHFLFPFKSNRPLFEHLKEYIDTFEKKEKKIKK